MADANQAAARQVADVVGAGQRDRLEELVIGPVEDVALAADAVADLDTVEVGGVGDTLDLFLFGDLLDELAGLEVHDVQAVMGQVGHEHEIRPNQRERHNPLEEDLWRGRRPCASASGSRMTRNTGVRERAISSSVVVTRSPSTTPGDSLR
jgi:hypothetical protein